MTKFTDKFVRDIEAPAKGNKVIYEKWANADAVKGFGVRITAAGARSFVLRYVFDSREYRYTIGPFPSLSAEAARREAKRLRATIDIGQTHPMAEREKKRGEARARREAETFAEAVDDYIIREQIGRRKNATANQVKRGLTTDCAAWKDRPVAEIRAADIRKLLENHPGWRQGHPSPPLPRQPDLRLPEDLLRLVRRAGDREDPALAHDRPEAPVGGRGGPPAVVHGRRAEGALGGRRRTRRGRWRLPQDGYAHGQAPERAGIHAVGPH
jgi:hypothetical protein